MAKKRRDGLPMQLTEAKERLGWDANSQSELCSWQSFGVDPSSSAKELLNLSQR